MDEVRLALDRLTPAVGGSAGWNDALRRASRLRRRRRRTLVAVVALAGAALFATLAAAGPIAFLVPHSRAPHLRVYGTLPRGTLEVEIERVAITLGPSADVIGWRTAGDPPRVRWFLDLAGGADRAVLVTGEGAVVSVLCTRCGAHESGHLDVTAGQIDALVDGRLRVVADEASGALALDRTRLHRGVICMASSPCRRIYTGR